VIKTNHSTEYTTLWFRACAINISVVSEEDIFIIWKSESAIRMIS